MAGQAEQDYFPADYASGRTHFRQAAAARGFALTAYLNPHAKGPAGEDLTTDVAIWGDRAAEQALLIMSGTHGVEGYAGSGCQLGFLNDPGFANPPRGLRIVLIHAINPYGFAWNRRVNEDNVDLNRNFVDHSVRKALHPGYEVLKDAIAPAQLDAKSEAAADAALAAYAREHGVFALQEAITQGQYAYPGGLYFGGAFETWSAGLLKHLLRREFASCGRVAIVDVHTGLGPYGYGELITEEPKSSGAYARARRWWGDTVLSTKNGESVSADVTGSVDGAFAQNLLHADVTACCLEYGTYATHEVFKALRADNWLHLHGDPLRQDAKEIKAQIRRAFYPDCEDWKELVWARARSVFAQAIDGLMEP